jgi:hypothetical protein
MQIPSPAGLFDAWPCIEQHAHSQFSDFAFVAAMARGCWSPVAGSRDPSEVAQIGASLMRGSPWREPGQPIRIVVDHGAPALVPAQDLQALGPDFDPARGVFAGVRVMAAGAFLGLVTEHV